MKRTWISNLVWICLLVAALIGSGYMAARLIRASIGYHVQSQFEVMPPDDDALKQWLSAQRGIVGHTVSIQRDGRRLDVMFIMTQDMFGYPPIPPLEAASRRLGYVGADARFHDVR